MRTAVATRYITPLREGGSLPALIEADDQGMYVLKFRGAGQGPKALIAELIAGEIARTLQLPIPEIVLIDLDPDLARTEPDAEIQHLLRASAGINLGMDYLPGSVTFDPLLATVDATLASSIVWFDAFTTNIDRTPRNANLLIWHRKLWLIDNGAALYFHHGWDGSTKPATSAFPMIKDHVLLPFAAMLAEVDETLSALLPRDALARIVAQVPDTWLGEDPAFADTAAHRRAYVDYFLERLAAPRAFVQEAIRARSRHL